MYKCLITNRIIFWFIFRLTEIKERIIWQAKYYKTKRNKTLQTSSGSKVSFDKLAETLGEVLDANVYVLNTKGKVLGLYLTDIQDSSVIIDEDTKQKR